LSCYDFLCKIPHPRQKKSNLLVISFATFACCQRLVPAPLDAGVGRQSPRRSLGGRGVRADGHGQRCRSRGPRGDRRGLVRCRALRKGHP
jgi:hypothetical protein